MMGFGKENSTDVLGYSHQCQLKSLRPQKMERLSGLEIFRYPRLRSPTTPSRRCRCTTSLPRAPTIVQIKEGPSTSPDRRQLTKTASAQSPLDSPSLPDFLLKLHTANCDLCEQPHRPLRSIIAGQQRRQRTWKLPWCNERTGRAVVLQSRPNAAFGRSRFQAPLHDEDVEQSKRQGGFSVTVTWWIPSRGHDYFVPFFFFFLGFGFQTSFFLSQHKPRRAKQRAEDCLGAGFSLG